jgi:hypothetical protein
MALRWKILVALGIGLIAGGLIIDWPSRTDPSIPETRSFLLFLGVVVGIAGVLIGFRQES